MQQFEVSRQRLTLVGSKSAKSSAEYYFVLGGTPKFEATTKKWACVVIRDSSIYSTPV